MILPIYTYGQNVLRKIAKNIDTNNYPNLQDLIKNMFETMYNADGIGLAAPQIGLDERIFVIDLSPLSEDNPSYNNFKKVFINAEILERKGNIKSIDEGCLSIPNIREKVNREESIKIKYIDENLQQKEEEFHGFAARCIQHEYDHIEGILFIDKISSMRKRMIKSKLNNIISGKIKCHYKIKTAK